MEKLEPKKERSPIGSLKFQRKSDYKKFRNFIKKKTKEIEKLIGMIPILMEKWIKFLYIMLH